ncbi:MAG: serine hydrolase [Sphingomonas sp.]|jgi:beta-lactamase class A
MRDRILQQSKAPEISRRLGAATIVALLLVGCQSSGPQAIALVPPPPVAIAPPVPKPVFVAPKPVAPAGLASSIDALVRQFNGKVGVAVQSIDRGWSVDVNGGTRLPQQSVSKLWVALTVLDFRDSGRLTLDDPVTVTREDLTLFHQPIAAMVKGDGFKTTVGELLVRALTMSDNTANDRLLRFVGGPGAVRDVINRKKLGDIRFGPGERLLQSQTAGLAWKPQYAFGNGFIRARAELPVLERRKAYEDYVANPPDGAAPAAIATALTRLKKGELLSANSTQWLIGTMEESKTGRRRLRGAVPPGWEFGHKTGTGQDLAGRTAGFNDVGILTAPDGQSYTIAVMIGDTGRPIIERQALMQSVLSTVVAHHAG